MNHLEVVHLPVYYPSEQEKDDPKLYADNVRKLMAVEVHIFIFLVDPSAFEIFCVRCIYQVINSS